MGYTALALIAVGIYAVTTEKYVANSEALLVFPPPTIDNATFTPIPGGWNISLHWRVDNPGRLPIRLAIFVFYVALDNRSDSKTPFDGATAYYINGSLQRDRLTGPVIAPGGSVRVDWWVNETSPEAAQRIGFARDPSDGGYYLAILGGQVVFYIDDINERQVEGLPRNYGRV